MDVSVMTQATDFLSNAARIMTERGQQYDKPEGERSMGAAVTAFNAITRRGLSEAEGWLLLQLLKDVRQWQRPAYHADSAEDCVAYAALKAEALARAEPVDPSPIRQAAEGFAGIAEAYRQGLAATYGARDPRTVVGVDVSFDSERHMYFAPDHATAKCNCGVSLGDLHDSSCARVADALKAETRLALIACGHCGFPYSGDRSRHCGHHYAEAGSSGSAGHE